MSGCWLEATRPGEPDSPSAPAPARRGGEAPQGRCLWSLPAESSQRARQAPAGGRQRHAFGDADGAHVVRHPRRLRSYNLPPS
eukprot:365509-Chlamydomonas_euryale.AAC.7